MGLSIRAHPRGAVIVLDVDGPIDGATSGVLSERLDAMVQGEHPRVVLDLTDVDFLDATGLGALVKGQEQARQASGTLSVVAPAGQARRLMRLTGMDRRLRVTGSVEEALSDPSQTHRSRGQTTEV